MFEEARRRLEGAGPAVRIVDWGYVSRQRFIETLSKAHVVVSTALHEFFGVSMWVTNVVHIELPMILTDVI